VEFLKPANRRAAISFNDRKRQPKKKEKEKGKTKQRAKYKFQPLLAG